MPVEITILAPALLPVEDQRLLAEAMNPPIIASESHGGGTLAFTEFDGTPVLTMGRARIVETQTDLRRLYASEITVSDDVTCWYEGVIPFHNAQRGIALMFAFTEASGGSSFIRGVQL